MQQEDCAKPQFIMTNANTSTVAVKFCLLPWKAEKIKHPLIINYRLGFVHVLLMDFFYQLKIGCLFKHHYTTGKLAVVAYYVVPKNNRNRWFPQSHAVDAFLN